MKKLKKREIPCVCGHPRYQHTVHKYTRCDPCYSSLIKSSDLKKNLYHTIRNSYSNGTVRCDYGGHKYTPNNLLMLEILSSQSVEK